MHKLPHDISIEVHGTVAQQFAPAPAAPVRLVYQGCRPETATHTGATGKPMQLRAWVSTPQRATRAQEGARAQMRAASAAARDPTPADLARAATYRLHARLTPRLRIIGSHIASHYPPTTTAWDNSTTSWDEYSTAWEPTPHELWDNSTTSWDARDTIWTPATCTLFDADTTRYDGGATQYDIT